MSSILQDFVAPALQQSGNYEAGLQAAFHAADAEVLEVCRRASMLEENFTGPGATATVVVVNPSEAITANLGDSSAVLQRKGRPVMLSREHRVYGKYASQLHHTCFYTVSAPHSVLGTMTNNGGVVQTICC